MKGSFRARPYNRRSPALNPREIIHLPTLRNKKRISGDNQGHRAKGVCVPHAGIFGCGQCARFAPNCPANAKNVRNSSPRASPWLGTQRRTKRIAHPHTHRTQMNTNTHQSVPPTRTAPARRSISLLQMLALIAFGGIAVSLLLRQFV